MDDYLICKLYSDWVTAGEAADTTEPTVENNVDLFIVMRMNMDEADIPAVGRLLYETPAIEKILKSAEGLARQMLVQNNNGIFTVSFH